MPRIPAAVLKAVCVLSFLAACGTSDPPPLMRASAEAADGGLQVRVDEIPPGRAILAIVLIDPQGAETPARERQYFTREEGSGGASGPGIGVGATGGSSSGIMPYITLGYFFSGDGEERRSRYLTGRIKLTDPEAYAVAYRFWHIEVRYRDAAGRSGLLTLAAPAP